MTNGSLVSLSPSSFPPPLWQLSNATGKTRKTDRFQRVSESQGLLRSIWIILFGISEAPINSAFPPFRAHEITRLCVHTFCHAFSGRVKSRLFCSRCSRIFFASHLEDPRDIVEREEKRRGRIMQILFDFAPASEKDACCFLVHTQTHAWYIPLLLPKVMPSSSIENFFGFVCLYPRYTRHVYSNLLLSQHYCTKNGGGQKRVPLLPVSTPFPSLRALKTGHAFALGTHTPCLLGKRLDSRPLSLGDNCITAETSYRDLATLLAA